MSNNIFNLKRFLMLAKQHFIHNNKLLLFASIAFVGVVFIFLTIIQMGNDRVPHDLEMFRVFFVGFISIFGILYTGYSFTAFRSKESTINYLMLPASVFEKFLFELLSRLSIIIILLPVLFWITFHLQGYFFNLFSVESFEAIGFGQAADLELSNSIQQQKFWFFTFVFSLGLLAFALPFTGGAMFTKQPLVKTLFAVAMIVIFFAACIFIAIEPLGIAKYQPNESMWLVPKNEEEATRFFASLLILTNLVILFVAYRKLKEREV